MNLFKADFYAKFYKTCLSRNKVEREFQGLSSYKDFLQKNTKSIKSTNFNLWELMLFSPAHLCVKREEWSELLKTTFDFIQDQKLSCSLNATHNPLGFDSPIMKSWFYNGSRQIDLKLIEEFVSYGWIVDEEFYNAHLRMMDGSESWDTITGYRWNFENAYKLWLNYFKKLNLTKENEILVREHLPKPNLKF